MTATDHGYAPAPGYLGKLLAEQPEFNSANMPDVAFKEYENIIDSSNATPWHWNKIAEDIAENYDGFDGFVILHGTDTMAYSASALSFQLGNLSKPVILTGSQIPFAEIRSDARENLIGAIQLATKPKLSEVSVYFHNELYRGNRTTKTDSSGFAAFESPNYPTLARVGIEIDINKRYLLEENDASNGLDIIHFQNNPEVGTLQIFPGITGRLLHNYLQQPVK
ncbi:MAG: asparaginase, partial [Gammaproteobacteria bacterium]|nr:asparaginase [Gammaproteobacteria bacterium]